MPNSLDTLLRLERDAILAGEYELLTELIDQKSLILGGIESIAPYQHANLLKNLALLRAARNGVQAGRRLMTEITQVAAGFSTYNELGKNQRIRRTLGTVSRKI